MGAHTSGWRSGPRRRVQTAARVPVLTSVLFAISRPKAIKLPLRRIGTLSNDLDTHLWVEEGRRFCPVAAPEVVRGTPAKRIASVRCLRVWSDCRDVCLPLSRSQSPPPRMRIPWGNPVGESPGFQLDAAAFSSMPHSRVEGCRHPAEQTADARGLLITNRCC